MSEISKIKKSWENLKDVIREKELTLPSDVYNALDCIDLIIKDASKPHGDDRVCHPSHYTWLKDLCGIEVIDITRHMDFDLGNSLKYILRAGHKKEQGLSDREKAIEDLKKAEFYIRDRIKYLENLK